MAKLGIFKCKECGDIFVVKLKDGIEIYHRCTDYTGITFNVELLGFK